MHSDVFDKICKCGHDQREHYGGVSVCLASKLLVWKCLCGYFVSVDYSNSRKEKKNNKFRHNIK